MSKQNILELRGVKTHFPIKAGILKRTVGSVKAVNGIDIDIKRGETIGLVGESGCGKTTLGKTILQLIRPTEGVIVYNGDDKSVNLEKLSDKELNEYRQKLQIIFQDPHSSLNPAFSIFASLEEPLKKFTNLTKAERRKLIGDLLETVNLRREYMDRYPHEFSGGQRQRIGVARALCVNPELIVCDEAVSALDVSIQAQVLKLLQKIKDDRGLTYIFITHDLSVVEYISDRIAVMYLGEIVELADTDRIFKNTLHPYTIALLSAIPVADLDHKKNRIVLKGDIPSPANPPTGCAFHPRCPKCMDICKKEKPKLKKYVDNGTEHYVACHLCE